MIDFHYVPTGNNLKIAIALEELALPCRLVKYDMYVGTHQTPEFRRINPNSKLPAIVDHDPADGGEPLPVFESGAILLYLAEKTGQLLPGEWRAREQARQWLVWQVAGLGPMLGQANHFVRYAPEGQDYGVERYLRESRRLLEVLNRRLRDRAYLAGDEYSVADIACYPWAAGTAGIGIDPARFPAMAAWLERIRVRPAIERGAKAIFGEDRGRYTQKRPVLTQDEWSTLFGARLLAHAQAQ